MGGFFEFNVKHLIHKKELGSFLEVLNNFFSGTKDKKKLSNAVYGVEIFLYKYPKYLCEFVRKSISNYSAGFALKEQVTRFLKKKKILFVDLGSHKIDPSDDYSDYGFQVAEKVRQGKGEGILICKAGGGMTIVANKVKGVRAVRCTSPREAIFAKEHNKANIIVLGSLNITEKGLVRILDCWFEAKWKNIKRHARRINKIIAYEDKHLR